MSALTSKQQKREQEVRRIRERALRNRLARTVPEHTGMLMQQDWGRFITYAER